MIVALDESHRPLVYQIRQDAENWLESKDIDQYRRGVDPTVVRQNIDREFDAGQFVGWMVDGQIVAIVALIEPDPQLWTPDELAEPQTYISRLMVAEGQRGKGYGADLLEAIADQAANAATTGSGSTAGAQTPHSTTTTSVSASGTSEPSTFLAG